MSESTNQVEAGDQRCGQCGASVPQGAPSSPDASSEPVGILGVDPRGDAADEAAESAADGYR